MEFYPGTSYAYFRFEELESAKKMIDILKETPNKGKLLLYIRHKFPDRERSVLFINTHREVDEMKKDR